MQKLGSELLTTPEKIWQKLASDPENVFWCDLNFLDAARLISQLTSPMHSLEARAWAISVFIFGGKPGEEALKNLEDAPGLGRIILERLCTRFATELDGREWIDHWACESEFFADTIDPAWEDQDYIQRCRAIKERAIQSLKLDFSQL